MNDLSSAILRTVVFFDIFDYPLTSFEIWKWLNVADKSLQDTVQSRNNHGTITDIIDQMSNKIESKNGFYFLKGRQYIIEKRLKRYNYAEDKFKRAIKFIKILRSIPFIKMMAICNTLAYSNATREGDIDLFIIAQKNRLWLTRLLTVGFLKWLGVRPIDENKQDAIDATFFLSEESLNIEELRIASRAVPVGRQESRVANQDIYLTYWVDQIVPVYDIDNTYQKFQKANQWIKETLPNSYGYQLNERRQAKPNWLTNIIQLLLVFLIDWNVFEKWSKNYQLKIMPEVLKDMMNKDSRVVVNDKMLKFHRDDRRAEYQRIFEEKLEMLK